MRRGKAIRGRRRAGAVAALAVVVAAVAVAVPQVQHSTRAASPASGRRNLAPISGACHADLRAPVPAEADLRTKQET